jgi:hypothetical protein
LATPIFPYLADDALEDLDTAHEIIPIHYERRENSQSVLSGREREQAVIPATFHDVVR